MEKILEEKKNQRYHNCNSKVIDSYRSLNGSLTPLNSGYYSLYHTICVCQCYCYYSPFRTVHWSNLFPILSTSHVACASLISLYMHTESEKTSSCCTWHAQWGRSKPLLPVHTVISDMWDLEGCQRVRNESGGSILCPYPLS